MKQSSSANHSVDLRDDTTHTKGYNALRLAMNERLHSLLQVPGNRLFTTDAANLFTAYLAAFEDEHMPFHTCTACRHFFDRYAGLVVLDAEGAAQAIWDPSIAPDYYRPSIEAVLLRMKRARVTGVFQTTSPLLGHPATGEWTHYYIDVPPPHLHMGRALTADQRAAEQAENYKQVRSALGMVHGETLRTVVTLLQAEALYRGDKIEGPMRWLLDLYDATRTLKHSTLKDNLIWRAVANAPNGFCHPRASVAFTLLEDIESGLPVDTAKRRFAEKMQPTQYQRPSAPPTEGNIEQGNELIRKLGLEPSLARRFATVDEIGKDWTPRVLPATESGQGGVFDHLRPQQRKAPASLGDYGTPMTWAKFAKTVLPGAYRLELLVPVYGPFAAITTAVHPDAPPLVRWDLPHQRNPFSVYTYTQPSPAAQWKLSAGAWAEVTAITSTPEKWTRPDMAADLAILILAGAADQKESGLALFPENMVGELHGVRATIEAFSSRGILQGRADASACGMIVAGSKSNILLRATNEQGQVMTYTVDRWD